MLENGDFFLQTLQAAMSSAVVHIAIFSERYAESPSCLAELSFMIKSGAPITPIFYHVYPTDLRRVHQGKGKYPNAFDRYVRKNRYPFKLNEWQALYKASFYKGEVIRNKDDEDKQLKNVVNTVLKIVESESSWVAEYPGGIISTGNNSGIISTGDGNVHAPLASPSASKPMKKPNSYHVFINHRGQDVKSTIAAILYNMLTRHHPSVFLDEPELENGDFFRQTLQVAMSSAVVHIAIFSERYAELSFMVESGVPIIPIFYHVDPTDLRRVHQGKGKYVDAFDRYVRKNRYLEKLNEWKKALYKASFYKGEVIRNKDDEDRQLKDIVSTVLKIVERESLWVEDYPVGINNTGNNSGIISIGDGNVQAARKTNYGSSNWSIGGKM